MVTCDFFSGNDEGTLAPSLNLVVASLWYVSSMGGITEGVSFQPPCVSNPIPRVDCSNIGLAFNQSRSSKLSDSQFLIAAFMSIFSPAPAA